MGNCNTRVRGHLGGSVVIWLFRSELGLSANYLSHWLSQAIWPAVWRRAHVHTAIKFRDSGCLDLVDGSWNASQGGSHTSYPAEQQEAERQAQALCCGHPA